MIDTALLIAGALSASMYFTADTSDEIELRALVDFLYRRIDWRWAQDGGDTIRQGWKPECGFLHYGWEGYSEAIVLYVLALGSPTHSIEGDCYRAWTATYQWENLYDHDYLYAGPLFVHHFSRAPAVFEIIRALLAHEAVADTAKINPRVREMMHEQRPRIEIVVVVQVFPLIGGGDRKSTRLNSSHSS